MVDKSYLAMSDFVFMCIISSVVPSAELIILKSETSFIAHPSIVTTLRLSHLLIAISTHSPYAYAASLAVDFLKINGLMSNVKQISKNSSAIIRRSPLKILEIVSAGIPVCCDKCICFIPLSLT